MKKKKSKKKSGVIIIVSVIVLALAVISLFSYIVYVNLFAGVESKRYEGLSEHVLTTDEIDSVKEVFSDLEQLDKVNVYIESNKNAKSKIIKIRIELKEDVDFDNMKELCNSSIEKISEDNLGFYDLEVFISSENEESEVYPQIGYKHVSKTTFSW